MNKNDLQTLADIAILGAKEAGKLISEYTNRSVTVQTKPGQSQASQVVTEVDIKCQNIILQHISPTCPKYDIALLAEESVDDKSRLEKDYFWCIDPLDGTLMFIEERPGYSVSIALVSRSGVPYIGVVYNPVENILYHAIKGSGVFRNGKTWNPQLSSTETESSHFETITHGGAVMNACWVLENSPACFYKLPKKQEGGGSLWDYAATACIFHELGAVATDIYGALLDLNRSESTFMNHKGVLYASNNLIAKKLSQNVLSSS